MACDPIPQLLVFHTCRCGTSPVHKWLQCALSWSVELARGLRTRWGDHLATGLRQAPCLMHHIAGWRPLSTQNIYELDHQKQVFHLLLHCHVTVLSTILRQEMWVSEGVCVHWLHQVGLASQRQLWSLLDPCFKTICTGPVSTSLYGNLFIFTRRAKS